MSWKASAWAKTQRLGSPAAKSVLMCLADYADPTGVINGWASQAQLAEDAEVSERSVREWMQRLEEWRLISRTRRSGARGERATDVIKLHLHVVETDGAARLKAEKTGSAETLPAESAGRTNRQPDASLPEVSDSPTGTEFRAYKEEPPFTSQSPKKESARASADGDDSPEAHPLDDTRRAEALFWRAFKIWPRFDVSPKPPMLAAWAKLTGADREAAADAVPRFLAACKREGVNHPVAISTYLGNAMWCEHPPEPAAAEADKPAVAAPWGKLWQAARMRELLTVSPAPVRLTPFEERLCAEGQLDRGEELRGKRAHGGWPRVNSMHDMAANRGSGITLTGADAAGLRPLVEMMEAVPVASNQFAAWRREHEKRGWPWIPERGAPPAVWLPKGGPDGLEAFAQALRGDDYHNTQEAAE